MVGLSSNVVVCAGGWVGDKEASMRVYIWVDYWFVCEKYS